MIKVDNISFNGRFRYMAGAIHSLDYVPAFEFGKDNIPKELMKFSENSKFLNKLKEDRDVFIHHHKEIFNEEPDFEKKGFFAKLFSYKKAEPSSSSAKIGKDHLSIIFENQKAENINDSELCEIHISLPINKNTSENLDRFEYVLDNISDIKSIRKEADKLCPDTSHKLTLLPYNSNCGWCEFWKGEKNPLDTFKRLNLAAMSELKNKLEQKLKDIT